MSIFTKISSALKISDKLSMLVIGAIAGIPVGFLLCSKMNCHSAPPQIVTNVIHTSDTVDLSTTDTIDHYIAVLQPVIDGDSVQYYAYQDTNLSLTFNYSDKAVRNLDYSIFRARDVLRIYDTTVITNTREIPAQPSVILSTSSYEFPIRLGASVELAASAFPRQAISVATEGYLRINRTSIFVRPQLTYPFDGWLWAGLRYEL